MSILVLTYLRHFNDLAGLEIVVAHLS